MFDRMVLMKNSSISFFCICGRYCTYKKPYSTDNWFGESSSIILVLHGTGREDSKFTTRLLRTEMFRQYSLQFGRSRSPTVDFWH